VRDWEPKLDSITAWFAQLQNVDLEAAPAARVSLPEESRLRSDDAYDCAVADAILALAPDREGAFYKVPKITAEEA